MSTTPPAPPPGPPSAPPPGPPSASPPAGAPGAAPPKSGGGGNIWLILFIVAGVLFVGALIFAIISFTGKSSAEDDKDKAQKELASTTKELGTSKGAGAILGDLVRTGAKSADDLKACTDSARTVQNQAIDVLNQKQAGTDVNPQIDALNAAIDQNTSLCNTSQQSYQAFVDALNKLQSK
jgi:hypothetical protein